MARPVARQMSFADLELLRQGLRLEPPLSIILALLNFEWVKPREG